MKRATPWLVLALAVLGCSGDERADPSWPNVVLVTLDTTRADHLGAYGYFRDTSPNLDAFAEQAIVFDDALAPMATTLPTHTSLLTATEPLEHGVLANLGHGGTRFVQSPALRSFAEVAADAGYDTAAFVSAAPLKRGSGIEQGFATFDEPAGNATARKGDRTVDGALRWLAGAEAPFLLWVHTYDAHWPFLVPEDRAHAFGQRDALEEWMRERRVAPSSVREGVGPEDALDTLERYDTALRFQDEQLGRLLDALAARDDWSRTAVVITADHGEGLSQHGHAAHGSTWQEHLHVPLLLRIPGESPRRVGGLVAVADVLPTLIPRLGVAAFQEIVQQTAGRDALSASTDARAIVSQETGRVRDRPGYRVSLTTPSWKYVRVLDGEQIREEMLYDRAADPFELADRAAAERDTVAELRTTLDAALAFQRARGERLRAGVPPATTVADPELRAQLCALGYVDEDCPAPEAAP
jgi:arylsulfatase